MTKISVIIPCYNQEKYIADCLDSVLAQTFDDYEAIVVDDGSTDNSVKIIKEYQKKSDKIRLIQQANQGVIAARNNAIKEAKGKYIYTLDSDDIIHETALEKSYKCIENGLGDIISSKNKCFVKISDINKKGLTNCYPSPTKFNMMLKNCITNSALFKKEDFEKCGGYDPTFAKGWEDYDLWLNMVLKHNLKIYRIDDFLFFYRDKETNESRDKQANKNSKMLKKLLYTKYPILRFSGIINKFCRFLYQKKVTRSGKLIIKIFKIPVFITK